jgi:hypothetical protein
VNGPDHIRPGEVQYLVAALEVVEVVQRQVVALQHRAHRTVGNHHSARECAAKIIGHLARIRLSAIPPEDLSRFGGMSNTRAS